MKLEKWGAIVPMARGARTEHLIIYFCNDWEELVYLLEAPLEYLRAQQFCWLQDAPESISWQLLTPITATIQCGLGSAESFSEVFAHLGPLLTFRGKKGSTEDRLRSLSVTQLLGRFRRTIRSGFYVEFATYTNAIRVLYFPDLSVTSTNRYMGGFTNPQLMTAQFAGTAVSDLHFDLTESTARMRADFIVNMLEAPQDITDRLTQEVVNGSMDEISYQLEMADNPRRHLLAVSPQMRRAMNPQTNFQPGSASSPAVTAPRARRPAVSFDDYVKYPTVIAHNLSEPVEASVCSVIKCPTRSGDTIGTGLVTVESYFRMLYDPQSVIERYA